MSVVEKVQEEIQEAGARYGFETAPHVLMYAAAPQTGHLSEQDAIKAFLNARNANPPYGAEKEAGHG